MPSQLVEEELRRTNKDCGREEQGGVNEAGRGWEEEEGVGIGNRGRGGVPGAGNNNSRGPNDCAADAPPSRFREGGPLPPTIAVDRRRPVTGSSREVMPWSGDGGDRRIKGLLRDHCIGEEDCPPPSSPSPIGDDVEVDNDNDNDDSIDDDENDNGGSDNKDAGRGR